MSQPLTSNDIPDDQADDLNRLEMPTDSTLDEAGWLALLIAIDDKEGGP